MKHVNLVNFVAFTVATAVLCSVDQFFRDVLGLGVCLSESVCLRGKSWRIEGTSVFFSNRWWDFVCLGIFAAGCACCKFMVCWFAVHICFELVLCYFAILGFLVCFDGGKVYHGGHCEVVHDKILVWVFCRLDSLVHACWLYCFEVLICVEKFMICLFIWCHMLDNEFWMLINEWLGIK